MMINSAKAHKPPTALSTDDYNLISLIEVDVLHSFSSYPYHTTTV